MLKRADRTACMSEWRGHLTAWRAVGGTLAAYARAHGLQPGAAYRWKRLLCRDESCVEGSPGKPSVTSPRPMTARPAGVPVRFARVAVRTTTPIERLVTRPMVVRLELAGGRYAAIEVVDGEQLVTVIRALEQAA
jgi:hypothetical protein